MGDGLGLGQLAPLGEALEVFGVTQQDFAQKLAAGEEHNQHFDHARVVAQEIEQLARCGRGARKTLETDQGRIGAGRGGQGRQQVWDARGQGGAHDGVVADLLQPAPRGTPVGKTGPSQQFLRRTIVQLAVEQQQVAIIGGDRHV